MPTNLRCDLVEATQATQVRTVLDKGVIDDYCEALKNGAIFPPIDVFKEQGSGRYILADGFHRLLAHIHAEIETIDCEVHEGGMHEALLFALGANAQHGLRRSNADKRNAVMMALKDPAISALLVTEIADICRVTKRTVTRMLNKQMTDDPNENGSHVGTKSQDENDSHKPTAADHRPTKKPPTQAEIERDELREACKAIRAFPYDGAAAGKLKLNKTDIANLEYVSTWCASAVLALRK